MNDLFVDRLLDAISRKNAPVCVGIDPIFEMLPDAIAGEANKRDANDLDSCLDAIHDFCRGVLETVAPLVPVVKFQSAYFEQYLWEGVEAYYELVQEAKDLGLLVIGDVKRGDIGSTSEAYANAHLAPQSFPQVEHIDTPDAITINPMLGMDAIAPFIRVAKETGKGLFVLVRTSNPGSADFQDAKLQDGRTWSEALADRLQPEAEAPGLMGKNGWSNIGAVVGATQPHTIESFRARLPKSIFLLPGYGTQGATAEMTRAAFKNGAGGLVSASRSVLYPRTSAGDWRTAVAESARKMVAEVAQVIPGMKLTTLLRTPALLLALLGVGLIGLWFRSFWRVDLFGCFWQVPDDPLAKRSPFTSNFVNITSGRGGIGMLFSWSRHPSSSNPPRPVIYGHESLPSPVYPYLAPRAPGRLSNRALGFEFARATNVQTSFRQHLFMVTVPIPMLLLLTLLLPGWWLIRRQRERRLAQRVAAGQCVRCGYDLRASKDRCPECGEPISSTATRHQ